MTINRNTWGWDERTEFDKVIAEVIASSKNTDERVDLFETRLNDALQAHRIWANDVERHSRRDGLAAEIRRFQGRHRAMVSHEGQVLNLPRVQGVRVRTADGLIQHQRELIEVCEWSQIREKRSDALKARGTYSAKVAHYDRLLALQDLVPEARSPAEAAKKLGVTIESWLSGEAIAA